jgi:hypothetical protein
MSPLRTAGIQSFDLCTWCRAPATLAILNSFTRTKSSNVRFWRIASVGKCPPFFALLMGSSGRTSIMITECSRFMNVSEITNSQQFPILWLALLHGSGNHI